MFSKMEIVSVWINQWEQVREGMVLYLLLWYHRWGSLRAKSPGFGIPITSNSWQTLSTCSSHEICGQPIYLPDAWTESQGSDACPNNWSWCSWIICLTSLTLAALITDWKLSFQLYPMIQCTYLLQKALTLFKPLFTVSVTIIKEEKLHKLLGRSESLPFCKFQLMSRDKCWRGTHPITLILRVLKNESPSHAYIAVTGNHRLCR